MSHSLQESHKLVKALKKPGKKLKDGFKEKDKDKDKSHKTPSDSMQSSQQQTSLSETHNKPPRPPTGLPLATAPNRNSPRTGFSLAASESPDIYRDQPKPLTTKSESATFIIGNKPPKLPGVSSSYLRRQQTNESSDSSQGGDNSLSAEVPLSVPIRKSSPTNVVVMKSGIGGSQPQTGHETLATSFTARKPSGAQYYTGHRIEITEFGSHGSNNAPSTEIMSKPIQSSYHHPTESHEMSKDKGREYENNDVVIVERGNHKKHKLERIIKIQKDIAEEEEEEEAVDEVEGSENPEEMEKEPEKEPEKDNKEPEKEYKKEPVEYKREPEKEKKEYKKEPEKDNKEPVEERGLGLNAAISPRINIEHPKANLIKESGGFGGLGLGLSGIGLSGLGVSNIVSPKKYFDHDKKKHSPRRHSSEYQDSTPINTASLSQSLIDPSPVIKKKHKFLPISPKLSANSEPESHGNPFQTSPGQVKRHEPPASPKLSATSSEYSESPSTSPSQKVTQHSSKLLSASEYPEPSSNSSASQNKKSSEVPTKLSASEYPESSSNSSNLSPPSKKTPSPKLSAELLEESTHNPSTSYPSTRKPPSPNSSSDFPEHSLSSSSLTSSFIPKRGSKNSIEPLDNKNKVRRTKGLDGSTVNTNTITAGSSAQRLNRETSANMARDPSPQRNLPQSGTEPPVNANPAKLTKTISSSTFVAVRPSNRNVTPSQIPSIKEEGSNKFGTSPDSSKIGEGEQKSPNPLKTETTQPLKKQKKKIAYFPIRSTSDLNTIHTFFRQNQKKLPHQIPIRMTLHSSPLSIEFPTFYNLTGIILCYIPNKDIDCLITDNLPLSLLANNSNSDANNKDLSPRVLYEKIQPLQMGWNIYDYEKENNSIIIWSVEDLFIVEQTAGEKTFVLDTGGPNGSAIVLRWRESTQSWRLLMCRGDTKNGCVGITKLLNSIFPFCDRSLENGWLKENMDKVLEIPNLKEEQRARISNLISSIQKIHEHFSITYSTLPECVSLEEINAIGDDTNSQLSNYISRFMLSFIALLEDSFDSWTLFGRHSTWDWIKDGTTLKGGVYDTTAFSPTELELGTNVAEIDMDNTTYPTHAVKVRGLIRIALITRSLKSWMEILLANKQQLERFYFSESIFRNTEALNHCLTVLAHLDIFTFKISKKY